MKDQVVVRPSLYVTARFACGHDDSVRREWIGRVAGYCDACCAARREAIQGQTGSPGASEARGQWD